VGLSRQEPLVIPSLAREKRFPRMIAFHPGERVSIGMRASSDDCPPPYGSIAVASKRGDAYCEEEVRFLSLVADQAALAVDDRR